MSTIFALATAPLKAGVAIIRVSGPKASVALSKLIKNKLPEDRVACTRKIYNPSTDQLIDDALILYFKAPRSFTGEDVVELHIHGSKAVIAELTDCLSNLPDLRMAEAGEFSRRAFENNKMDLTQAEGLADLIDAETKIQAKFALRQAQGELHTLYESWRGQLLEALANIEAYIDFPDEELPQELTKAIDDKVGSLKNNLKSYLINNKNNERIRDGLYIAILGAPNAGKSSLINLLAKRDVAIVSEIAGTTRDVIEAHMDIGGYPVVLADTAGLRDKARKIEGEGVKRALDRAKNADLKIIVFDARKLKTLDKKSVDLIDGNSIVLINKIDLADNKNMPKEISNIQPICVSVNDNKNIDLLINSIKSFAENFFNISDGPIISRLRHKNLLNDALSNLERFDINNDLDLAAEDLRLAARSLGRITGKIDVENILDEIFSNFCIGK